MATTEPGAGIRARRDLRDPPADAGKRRIGRLDSVWGPSVATGRPPAGVRTKHNGRDANGRPDRIREAAISRPHRADLIVASINLRNFLESHEGMPPLGAPSIPLSFTMPEGDDAKLDRLAGIAAWLNVEPENRNGTFWAYRNFGGLRLGAHFTPDHIRRERARSCSADRGSGMMPIRVTVTQEHIKAEPRSCPSCPIALALTDALPGAKDVRVFNDGAHVRMPGRNLLGVDFPLEAYDFMHRFDSGKSVKPLTFTARATEVPA